MAVDVGASPGGWCQRLAEVGLVLSVGRSAALLGDAAAAGPALTFSPPPPPPAPFAQDVGLVIGIDPGDLEVPHVVYNPETGELPKTRDGTIVHVRARVEDCDALLSRLRPVRVCTIDMNCLHSQSLAFVATMAPYMSIGATLVRTSGWPARDGTRPTRAPPHPRTPLTTFSPLFPFQILTIKLMQKASYLIPIIRGVQDDLRYAPRLARRASSPVAPRPPCLARRASPLTLR